MKQSPNSYLNRNQLLNYEKKLLYFNQFHVLEHHLWFRANSK